MSPSEHTRPPPRRPWWWLIGAAAVVVAMLVPLTFVTASNKYVYWFQAHVMGRTCEAWANVLPPPKGFTGRWTTYHANLSVDGEMDIVDGKLQGRWRRYDATTGLVWWSGEYADNIAVGDWYWYDPASGRQTTHAQGSGFRDPSMDQPFMLFWISF